MRGGKLDVRLKIQRATQTRNRTGEVVNGDWSPVATVWAGERNTAAAERYTGTQLVAETDSVFEMRSWPGPAVFGPEERFRVVLGEAPDAVAYNVLGIVKLPKRGSGVMVMCRARAETTPAMEGPPSGE